MRIADADTHGIVYPTIMRRRIIALFALLGAVLWFGPSLSLAALEQEIHIGTEDGWRELQSITGVTFESGWKGFLDIRLKDGEYRPSKETDLLIHFNHAPPIDESGNYLTSSSSIDVTSTVKKLGPAAGVFYNEPEGLSLIPGENTIFSPGGSWTDFTLEFWLYPATLTEGSTILLWKGALDMGGSIIGQEIRCSIHDRRLVWDFVNVFLPIAGSRHRIRLEGRSGLLPRKWRHHLLRFRSDTGLMEYFVDGTPQHVTHTTENGRENGDIYTPVRGTSIKSSLVIGMGFSGLMDEMRFSRSFIEEPFLQTFRLETGNVMTGIYDLGYRNSRLISIDVEESTPVNTEVVYYYLLQNDKTAMRELMGEWKPFIPGVSFPIETRGRYLQLLVELFPDGSGERSPNVSSISIKYEPDFPPHPPGTIFASPGDESIGLEWQPSLDSDVMGYLIYYGEKPGYYFGAGSNRGDSPIDVGLVTSVTLEELTNGKLYYFALVSYDGNDPPHVSEFSTEITARPSRIYGTEE